MNYENVDKIKKVGLGLVHKSRQQLIEQIAIHNIEVFSFFVALIKAMQSNGAISIELYTKTDLGLPGGDIGWKFFEGEVSYGKSEEKDILDSSSTLIAVLVSGLDYHNRLQHFLEGQISQEVYNNCDNDDETKYILKLTDKKINDLIENYCQHCANIFINVKATKDTILSTVDKINLEAGLSQGQRVDNVSESKIKI